jgi:GT2 family glycosyltransferase
VSARQGTDSVGILIPAYERSENLQRTLNVIVGGVESSIDILVVDDCSKGQAIVEACQHYKGRVRYVRTPANLGVIGARNFGIEHLCSDIVLNFDDDSYFESPTIVGDCLTAFRQQPDIGALAFNIHVRDRGDTWNRRLPPFRCRTYTGCGNAWRREAINRVGSFYPGFWRQGEELEHAMRLRDGGYGVLALPSQVVVHEASEIHRNPRLHMSLNAANYLKRIILRVPASELPFALLRWIAFVIRHSGSMSLSQVLLEFRHSERGLRRALQDRNPISTAAYRALEQLKREELDLRRSTENPEPARG